MSTQPEFIPYSVSKTPQERAEYVKANPQMYAPKPQYDLIKGLSNKLDALDAKMNQIHSLFLAKK